MMCSKDMYVTQQLSRVATHLVLHHTNLVCCGNEAIQVHSQFSVRLSGTIFQLLNVVVIKVSFFGIVISTHTHTHTHTHMHTHTCMHACTHTRACICARMLSLSEFT